MPMPASSSRRRNSTSTGSDPVKPLYETPSRPRSGGRTASPPLSVAATSTVTPYSSNQPMKMNVVTRVAIEGKAKQGLDGAGVKMYLKLSVPLDNVSPGQTIQLFPEENIKILDSIVHPLDASSTPYDFNSMTTPLLHSAARALNLPARSQQTFQAAFGLSPPPGASSTTSRINGSASTQDSVAPVDPAYAGQILVSGYYISFVLPKVFPPRYPEDDGTSRSKFSSRRLSIGDRDRVHAQFVAAIDLWVPYLSKPPRSPYLLSIPTPRCLHNNIKLRIFPPVTTNTSASFASLSSTDGEDSMTWDLASDPYVTRSTVSRSRSKSNSTNGYGYNSYHGNEADDESSDSSTAGFSYGIGIQGSFPSTERIRLRWAKPVKNLDIPRYGRDDMDSSVASMENGRHRVGVKSIKGEMSCIVKGKMMNGGRSEGAIMDVEYKGTCKDVWYPGVAVLLGMDVGLEAKNSDVTWYDGEGSPGAGWEVTGGTGYTGFDVGVATNPRTLGRFDSLESNSSGPQIYISPSSPSRPSNLPSRQNSSSSAISHNSNSSTSSLLRAPLPGVQNVAEYSFEKSNPPSDPAASAASTQLSSLGSLPTSVNLAESTISRPPGYPITLHLNMNELLPPAKNEFIFSIKGTIVVTPRARPNPRVNGHVRQNTTSGAESDETTSAASASDTYDRDPIPITLPRFSVLAADKENTTIMVRNDIPIIPRNAGASTAAVEVYNSSGDILLDAQARKTVLQKGGFTKCSDGGGRIVIKMPLPLEGNVHADGYNQKVFPSQQPPSRTPNGSGRSSPVLGHRHTSSLGGLTKATQKMRPKRDGELMIPWVVANVTMLLPFPFPSLLEDRSNAYAVRAQLPAPADMESSEWLEFGLAKPGSDAESGSALVVGSDKPPNVDIVSVSVDGVPIKFEMTAAAVKTEPSEGILGGVKFEEMSSKDWISWVRVRVGGVGGGNVVIDYVVKEEAESERKRGKRRADAGVPMHVYLPTFAIPVGKMSVLIEDQKDVEVSGLQSNLRHSTHTKAGQKLLHYAAEPFFYPQVSFFVKPPSGSPTFTLSSLVSFTVVLAFLVASVLLHQTKSDLLHIHRSLGIARNAGWDGVPEPEPVTITTTVYASSHPQWDWFGKPGTKETDGMDASTSIFDYATTITTATISPELPSSTAPTPAPPATQESTEIIEDPEPFSFIDTFGLVPYQKLMNFTWGDFRPLAKQVAHVVGVLWQVARKIYHYPLDPP
ncbi:replication factor-a protein 1 [Moniliophthora roreri]|nr:replication factor-a protein 1 [Moniliophthora roreri]